MKLRTSVIVLAWAAAVWAQGVQQPARDVPAGPTIGTAAISGLVIDDEDQPKPVRRAVVTLTGGTLRPSRGAITDDAGQFTIQNLPAGRFTLTVSRASFVTSAYGAKRPGRPGVAIAVAEGQRVSDVRVRLWRGAAIAGMLRDEAGAPVPNVPVTAVQLRAASTPGMFTLNNNGAMTNDLGEFRIFGLEPGSYAVMVKPTAGGGGPMTAMSEADVDATFAAIRRVSAPAAPQSAPTPPLPPAAPFAYAPIYFPGTAVVSQATPIVLTPGQEATGVEFALQRVPTAVVTGTISRMDGTLAAGVSIQITAIEPAGSFVSGSPLMLLATTNPDGSFRVPQVTPGEYHLLARLSLRPPSPTDRGGFVSPGASAAAPALWAVADISVSGTDLTGVSLVLEPGMTMTGAVKFDASATRAPADLTKVRVSFVPASVAGLRAGTPISTMAFVPPVTVRADGTFDMGNITPGSYRFSVIGPGIDAAGWWARSALAGDRDLLDGQIEVTRATSLTNVVVTLSDRHTELSGMLTASGQPVSDVFVIAYGVDRRTWVPGASRVRAVRPGADGRYVINDLPPGDYWLGAVTDIDQDEWQDPAVLDRLRPSSTKITIGEGERKVQDLRIGG